MMEVTNSLSTDFFRIKRGLQTEIVQFIPQIVSTLRRELVFWEDRSDGENIKINKKISSSFFTQDRLLQYIKISVKISSAHAYKRSVMIHSLSINKPNLVLVRACSESVHTILVSSGHILDSIQVNGQHFGAAPHRGPDKERINLAQGEKVTSIQYQFGRNGFSYCNLKIHTNVDSYGPYAIKDNYRYCDMKSPLITRNIPNGDFLAFMRQHSQKNKDGQIELN